MRSVLHTRFIIVSFTLYSFANREICCRYNVVRDYAEQGSYICPQPSKVTSNPIRLKISTGIKNAAFNKLKVYPNPANDRLMIEGLQGSNHIRLTDAIGRVVYQSTTKEAKHIIDMQHFATGNYVLEITDAQGNAMSVKVGKE
ncbi:hypothetical protein CAP35_05130 [Chitinophagaceae bacterium IBVUCB1]|nr:hypothetical protein CAP35_05130 [Chitinophagaceae bacterium IBVUCB1]